jgi:hypothetical protein
LSTSIYAQAGNDTIDHYPLPYEGKLTKLLCISRENFKKLKAALDEFGIKPKPASSKPKTPFPQRLPKKEPLGGPRNDDIKPGRNKCTPLYEPTNIIHTRDSSLWRWQRMRAWFKEQELYEDGNYQYREITIENKEYDRKRHILV